MKRTTYEALLVKIKIRTQTAWHKIQHFFYKHLIIITWEPSCPCHPPWSTGPCVKHWLFIFNHLTSTGYERYNLTWFLAKHNECGELGTWGSTVAGAKIQRNEVSGSWYTGEVFNLGSMLNDKFSSFFSNVRKFLLSPAFGSLTYHQEHTYCSYYKRQKFTNKYVKGCPLNRLRDQYGGV